MAITKTASVDFVFENTNGVFYDVKINRDTGQGAAYKHGVGYKAGAKRTALTATSFSVDAGSLSAWQSYHKSRAIHAPAYNTNQTLNAVLNAVS